MSRPPMYRPELAQQVLDLLAQGHSLRAIGQMPGLPSHTTIRNWVVDDTDGFAERYARSRDLGLDMVADEVMAIVDTPVGSTENGGTDSGAVADKRLRFDARRWYLSKLAPKRYGEKLTQEISGPDGKPVQATLVIATGVPDSSDDEIA